MSDRIFENSCYWVVSRDKRDFKVHLLDPEGRGKVIISIENSFHGIDGIALTAEEATLLKEFLIRKGY
jgi:hypothetical protein